MNSARSPSGFGHQPQIDRDERALVKPLTAGSEIDAWCTRCRMDLGHRIVAMVGGAPKRVICQTCNSEHNYREPRTLKDPSSVFIRNKKTEAKPTAAQPVTHKGRAEQDRYDASARRARAN